MTFDHYGLATCSDEPAAVAAFTEAVREVAAHRRNAGAALARTLEADPGHVPALALKGFAAVVLAREELAAPARACLEAARAALASRDGGTADETVLVAALAEAVEGRLLAASDRLDRGFADRPATLLPFKLSQSLRFMAGDRRGMLAASERMLDAWSEDLPGAGFLAGCHAFALEEHGLHREAEAVGRRAVALEPADAWGLHAVGHVHEMRGDTEAGIAWLEAGRPSWRLCNNFAFHMAWHLALMRLERGEHEAALALYDEEVCPEPSDDFRDMANAVSLLWRLQRRGVDVGRRWSELAEIARRRRRDTSLVFAALHALAALVALGDHAGIDDTLGALEAKARGADDQARVAAEIGLPLARIIAGRCDGRSALPLDRVAERLPALGGSNAQRDMFMLALAEAAVRRGDEAALARVRAARRRLHADDALIAAIEGRGVGLAVPA